MKNLTTLNQKNTVKAGALYMALELSASMWRIAFSEGSKERQIAIEAGHLAKLMEEVAKAKTKLRLRPEAAVISCYEAGRDGFWIHRYLTEAGITNYVVDSASLEVNRRARRAKTDRLDAQQLLLQLMRYVGGETRLWQVVRVPSAEEEDARRLHRERQAIIKERTRHRNRIKSLLVLQGIQYQSKGRQKWPAFIEKVRSWNGEPLPSQLKEEILRETQRLELVEEQLAEIEKYMEKIVAQKVTTTVTAVEQIKALMLLKGVGLLGAWELTMEWFSWRRFKNRREVGALAGLVGTPYDSGSSQRDQGISKAGNKRIRALLIQLAWSWLRYQPNSHLSLWFRERFNQSKRFRKVGIVALARRLAIDLWRCATQGIVPKGAELKSTL